MAQMPAGGQVALCHQDHEDPKVSGKHLLSSETHVQRQVSCLDPNVSFLEQMLCVAYLPAY